MYTVLIVDDERNIRDGLKLIIDWKKYDCSIVGDVDDGELGYLACKELNPDIVITDIKMPKMDGMEMIRKIKEDEISPKFIVLSGFSEFAYAKSAIELGVKSYILKPIDEVELQKSIKTVITEIENSKEKKEIMESYRDLALKDIVDGFSQEQEDITMLLTSINTPLISCDYTCGVIEISELSISSSNDSVSNLETYLNDKGYDIYTFLYRTNQIGFILYQYPSESEKLYTLHQLVSDYLSSDTVFAIGNTYDTVDELSTSFYEAMNALNHKIIKGNNTVISYESLSQQDNVLINDSYQIYEQLERLIEELDTEGCRKLITDYYNDLKNSTDISLLDLQLSTLYFIIPILRKMPNIQSQLTAFLKKDMLSLQEIFRFNTIDALANWLINVVRSIVEIMQKNRIKKNKNIINQIIKYMNENYAENITLSSISEEFYINPYYLSQLFKKKTGNNYLQLLTKIRLNKASKLLKETDMKMYEISEAIGYKNTKYFSKIFEKHYGYKPTDYRRNSNMSTGNILIQPSHQNHINYDLI